MLGLSSARPQWSCCLSSRLPNVQDVGPTGVMGVGVLVYFGPLRTLFTFVPARAGGARTNTE